MRPDLYAEINENIVFNKLTYETQVEIARRMLEQEFLFLSDRGYALEAEDDVLSFKGFPLIWEHGHCGMLLKNWWEMPFPFPCYPGAKGNGDLRISGE